MNAEQIVESLRIERGTLLAFDFAELGEDLTLALGTSHGSVRLTTDKAADPYAVLAAIETLARPRWLWWSIASAARLVRHHVHLATCWDLVVVHRLLFGSWRADPGRIVAALDELSATTLPVAGQLDLGGGGGDDPRSPIRADGHLNTDWAAGAWASADVSCAQWIALMLRLAEAQHERLEARSLPAMAILTARSESTAELLCAELAHHGLPIDRTLAVRLIQANAGPRPTNEREAEVIRRARDQVVLAMAPGSDAVDLRNPNQVKEWLRRLGIDVVDTRASRLRELATTNPVVDELLRWRKAERIATTYGYDWLDANVGEDDRLRGAWSASDGAAGRMTAQAGLHNLPVVMRSIVSAGDGFRFVRADLGQIEPRVLAAVSGDRALAQASQSDDLYLPVAKRLGVERDIAKVAVLAAMYGQTSGVAGQALRGMESSYPVAMDYLQNADRNGRAGRDVTTYGGRLIRMWADRGEATEEQIRANSAARGRYARNAMVQGAAAELFKVWAVLVRGELGSLDGEIVLCLHDELLVRIGQDRAEQCAAMLDRCLDRAAALWAPGTAVRFVADIGVVERWNEAKG